MASRGLETTMRTALGECWPPARDGLDDRVILHQEVVAGHAGLAGESGRDDDDVGARGVGVVVGAQHPAVEPFHRAGLGEVEPLALGQPFHDVDEDDVPSSFAAAQCAAVAPTKPPPPR